MAHDPGVLACHVRPNIFDAIAGPELILPLVLANLASPRLWALSEKLRARVKDFPDDGNPHGLSPFLHAARKQIDRDFEHLRPETVSALLGDLDLAAEAKRLGGETVGDAVAAIERTVRYRINRGTLKADSLLDTIAAGRFPAYIYGNIDVIRAQRRLVERTRAPAGLTSCLDEAAMFAALAMTFPGGTMHDMVLLGAPSHYTAFGRDGAGRPFWFYGKNALFSKTEWDALVTQDYAGNVQQAFDDRLPDADRILSIEGLFDRRRGTSRITQGNLESIATAMAGFFGTLPEPLASAFEQKLTYLPPSGFAPIFRQFIAAGTHTSFEAFLRKHDATDDIETDLIAAAYRSLKGCDPRAFLIAARQARLRGLDLTSHATLLAQLRALPLRVSIFDDRERIAMPDETLMLGGGSDRDMALLLHVALERRGIKPVTLLTETESFVCTGASCIAAETLAETEPPAPNAVLYRWSA